LDNTEDTDNIPPDPDDDHVLDTETQADEDNNTGILDFLMEQQGLYPNPVLITHSTQSCRHHNSQAKGTHPATA